jgi:hypothetical protein
MNQITFDRAATGQSSVMILTSTVVQMAGLICSDQKLPAIQQENRHSDKEAGIQEPGMAMAEIS